MASFVERGIGRILKRSRKHDGQAGKPSDIIVGSSGSSRDTSKSNQVAYSARTHSGANDRVASPTVHSTASAQQPPATVSPRSSPQATLPAPIVSAPQPTSFGSATFIPSSLRGSLWKQTYDELKAKERDLVDAYERILSRKLSKGELSSTDLEPPDNDIEQENPEKMRSQMMRLIQAGLDETEKEAVVKQRIEDGMQAVHSVRGIIDRAVKAAPEAALAWVGVCFVLEILENPISEAVANRRGLAYVVSRMDWYWNLSDLLLDRNRIKKSSAGLRDELEKHVLELYKKLLAYQMRSICSYYRNRGVVFLRDMIKLDGWNDMLKSIKDAEDTVRDDSGQYNTLQIRAHLQDLVNTAGSEERKLQDIYVAIQDQTTQHRKRQDEKEDQECIKNLRLTDPRDDKKRIEETKGGLLEDSYRWILYNANFHQWRNELQNRLLWIKGDPGKGKTMLLCGIANELEESLPKTDLLSYFFCQATDARINNATAVLRGLLYVLVDQQPSLVSYIRKKHDHAGKALFEDANAWVALCEIFTNILQDPSLSSTYLIIDALDECVADLPKLLDFIVKQSSASPRVKWIVSSRNWPDIEERLAKAGQGVRLSLELNAESVSAAVGVFIQQKVLQLSQDKKYNDKTREAVHHHLSSNADGTFLWVALVCQNLKEVPKWNVIKKLNAFPPGLDSLYEQMMQQISHSDDADVCKDILALAATVYRPTTLDELLTLVEQLEDVADDLEPIREIIGHCGSFLTLRDNTVYFVHQSAKEFLIEKASNNIFPSGIEEAHQVILSRSLQAMSSALQRDMYNLHEPGYPIERVEQPEPDPLGASRYSCIYWIDHLCAWNPISSAVRPVDLQDGGSVDKFLRQKYLYWLEALSLCKSMSKAVVSIAKLEALVNGRADSSAVLDLIQDARRFIMYHKGAIESAPLQAYVSALAFSPTKSLIRNVFKREAPPWLTIMPAMTDKWGACLQTLEGHGGPVCSVAFSPDSAWLASASGDSTVKVWDASSGACLQTLDIGRPLLNISFDATGSRIHTEIGAIVISGSGISNNTAALTEPQHPQYQQVAISSDNAWITYNSKKLVWLPSEYRPFRSTVSGKSIGIGVRSGKVWICNIALSEP